MILYTLNFSFVGFLVFDCVPGGVYLVIQVGGGDDDYPHTDTCYIGGSGQSSFALYLGYNPLLVQ